MKHTGRQHIPNITTLFEEQHGRFPSPPRRVGLESQNPPCPKQNYHRARASIAAVRCAFPGHCSPRPALHAAVRLMPARGLITWLDAPTSGNPTGPFVKTELLPVPISVLHSPVWRLEAVYSFYNHSADSVDASERASSQAWPSSIIDVPYNGYFLL